MILRESLFFINKRLFPAAILTPDFRVGFDEYTEQVNTLGRIQIHDLHTPLAQPLDSALRRARFSDNDRIDAKLNNEPAAIPARRQRRRQDCVSVASPASSFSERIGLAVNGWVSFLHSTVVTAAKQRAHLIEQRGPNWNSTFGTSEFGFGNCNFQHRVVIWWVRHRSPEEKPLNDFCMMRVIRKELLITACKNVAKIIWVFKNSKKVLSLASVTLTQQLNYMTLHPG
jgi:hypothetical protein